MDTQSAPPKSSALHKVQLRLVRDDVVSSLRAAILDGTYLPGQRLVEREIADHMGISRGPIREAIRELEREGLVTTLPYKGAIVATFSEQDVREIFELRQLLEGYAARLAAEKATPADIERLEKVLHDMLALAQNKELSALVEKDIEFHSEICCLSGNAQLCKVWSSLESRIRLVLTLVDQAFYEPEVIAEMHRPILEAIRNRNPDLAEKSTTDPMREVAQTIAQAMAS